MNLEIHKNTSSEIDFGAIADLMCGKPAIPDTQQSVKRLKKEYEQARVYRAAAAVDVAKAAYMESIKDR